MLKVPTLALASACFVAASTIALAQHSPAPDRPAEGPRMANPGTGPAPGVHPPAPMEGNRFAPGPPPGTTKEDVPGGRVKTVETVTVPTPGPTARVSPGPTKAASAAVSPAPAPSPTKGPATARKRMPSRRPTKLATPAATPRTP